MRRFGAPLVFRERAGDPKRRGTFAAYDIARFGYDYEAHDRARAFDRARDPKDALGDALGCWERPAPRQRSRKKAATAPPAALLRSLQKP